jgi:hypothetical protein
LWQKAVKIGGKILNMLLFQIRFPTVGGKANENLRMCPYFDRCAKHGESPLHHKWGEIVIMISKWVCDR